MSLITAKEILASDKYTCVLTDGETIYTSCLRGVKPLVQFLEEETIPEKCYAADKVVGKATAFLYVLLRVQAVYARVISEPAVEVLCAHGIAVEHDMLVPHIINRRGDGICPFEEAVMAICDPNEAYTVIRQTMDTLHISLTSMIRRNDYDLP